MAADLTRVKLQPAVANTDYVNASWVPGYRWSGDNIRELSSDSSIAGATGSSSCRSTRAATRWRPSGTWCGRPGPGQSFACPPSNSRSVDISTIYYLHWSIYYPLHSVVRLQFIRLHCQFKFYRDTRPGYMTSMLPLQSVSIRTKSELPNSSCVELAGLNSG